MRFIEQLSKRIKQILKNNGFNFSLVKRDNLLKLVTLTILLLVFENSFLEWFKIFGVRPNLALCLIVFLSFTQESAVVLLVVLLAGIIKDSFSGFIFGLNLITFFSTMFLCFEIKRRLFVQKIIIFILVALLGIWISFFIFCFYSFIYELNYNFFRVFFMTFMESLYSCAVFYLILKYLYHHKLDF